MNRINENDFAVFFFAAMVRKGKTSFMPDTEFQDRLGNAYNAYRAELEKHCKVSFRIAVGIHGSDTANDILTWPIGHCCGYYHTPGDGTLYLKAENAIVRQAMRHGQSLGIDIDSVMDKIVEATLDPSKLPAAA